MSTISGLFSESLKMESAEPESLSSFRFRSNEAEAGTIEKIIRSSYENNLYTDIKFNVQCGDDYIDFDCHKLIMAIRSPYFEDLFFGETSKSVGDSIKITDVPPSAFEALVRYIYGSMSELDKNRNDVNYLLKVYKAANIYDVEPLMHFCCERFGRAIPTKDNIFELLDAAVLTNLDTLKSRCYKVLQTQTKEILSSRDHASINISIINTILDMPVLSLRSEYDLIQWLFDWGRKKYDMQQSNLITFKTILDPFLPRLSFLSLRPEEFGRLVVENKDFFDASEGFGIFMNIVLPGSWLLPTWCNGSKKSSRSFKPEGNLNESLSTSCSMNVTF